ncbi:MAG TPA: class I SAM-dependent methyltransferase, partial [Candidatus Dormibacteraeota bacterium]
LSALADVGAFPAAPDILDFGGGYGLMTQMLLDAGYSAWTSDPHVPKPYFAPDHVVADLSAAPPGTYDLVLALEVFEHLVQPVEVGESLARVLRAGGSLLISTEIYKPDQHGPEWGYLATEGGQHVNFWSQRALEIFAAHLGFTSIGLYPGDTGFLIVMSHLDEGTLAARLQAALERLDDPAFLASCLRPWDFRTSGVIPAGARPLARSVQLGDVLR